MYKKRLIVSIDNLPPGVMEAIRKKYPLGYSDYVIRVPASNGGVFYGITVDTEYASYLVKVRVKIDNREEKDKLIEYDGSATESESENIEIDPDDETYSHDPDEFDQN